MYKTISRRTIVFSFLISAFFGLMLIVQGLFIQAPISIFSSQSNSTLHREFDKGFASSKWHPEWFRARYFYINEDLSLTSDLNTMLHKDWIFFPSFSFVNESVELLRDEASSEQLLLFEFSENLYVEEVTTMQFDVHSPLSYQMFVNETPLSTKHNLTLSKGSHTWSLRTFLPPGEHLDLHVQISKDGQSWQSWKPGDYHGYLQRHGENRTGFRLDVEDIFQLGDSTFQEESLSRLNDIWFGINEGRFLGRIVIEVHNKDGGMSLSQSRALALAKWLVEKGSPSKLITVQGYGDYWLEKDDAGRIDILLLH